MGNNTQDKYYGIRVHGKVTLFTKKISCIYQHIKYRRRDKAMFCTFTKARGNRMLASGNAMLVE